MWLHARASFCSPRPGRGSSSISGRLRPSAASAASGRGGRFLSMSAAASVSPPRRGVGRNTETHAPVPSTRASSATSLRVNRSIGETSVPVGDSPSTVTTVPPGKPGERSPPAVSVHVVDAHALPLDGSALHRRGELDEHRGGLVPAALGRHDHLHRGYPAVGDEGPGAAVPPAVLGDELVVALQREPVHRGLAGLHG